MKRKIRGVHVSSVGLVLLCIFTIWSCRDSGTKSDKIDVLLKHCCANSQFNGNVLVAEKGKIIYHNAFGISNYDPVDSLKMKSQFRLGSVTKQFTAMAIMILKERDQLDYDDEMRKYLPDLPYQGIIIRHLLTHTSGLPDYMTLFNQHWEAGKRDNEKTIVDNDDVITLLAKHHPDVLFKPGEKWSYSNTGYVLLASIVSKAAGESFEKFLKKNIFNPLNMSRSLVYSAIRNDSMEDRVFGLRLDINGSDYIPNDYHYLNGVAGDGAVYSTTGDLFKWDRALYTEKLVSNATLEEAFTPVVLNNDSTFNYGFGWRIDTGPTGKKRVAHGGGWVGFVTAISREIEEDNTVILLTNHSSRYLSDIQRGINNVLHDRPYTLPRIAISDVMGRTLVTQGVEAAVFQYHDLKKTKSDLYNFNVRELNGLGYRLMELEKLAEAIEMFKLNVASFPESSNTYDSLGEAYIQNGNTKLAIENYKKSLEFNPENTNASEKLKQLTKD